MMSSITSPKGRTLIVDDLGTIIEIILGSSRFHGRTFQDEMKRWELPESIRGRLEAMLNAPPGPLRGLTATSIVEDEVADWASHDEVVGAPMVQGGPPLTPEDRGKLDADIAYIVRTGQ